MTHRGIELRVRVKTPEGTWSELINSDSDALHLTGIIARGVNASLWLELLTMDGWPASPELPFSIEYRPVELGDPVEERRRKVLPPLAERMEAQRDPRPPLCVWCTMSTYFSACHITMRTKRPLTIASLNGLEIPANERTPLYGHLAGYPDKFVRVARELGPDPDIEWMINQSVVGAFAEMELFGTKVCTGHLYDALEAWRRGEKTPGGWR